MDDKVSIELTRSQAAFLYELLGDYHGMLDPETDETDTEADTMGKVAELGAVVGKAAKLGPWS